MECKYPHILSPIRLGNTLFRNRIFASPVSHPDLKNEAGMTPRQAAFYGLRARGGAASVSTGDGVVHFETGFLHPYKLRLDDRELYPSLSDMARTVRQYGAVPTLELSHGGKFANVSNFIGDMKSGKKPYGPDHEFAPSGEEIFEMPREMIEEIAASYGRAAALAKEAGFGMVLIHAGHGWLLSQFMSPASNHRTDEFGGSFENRMRFTLMVIDSIRRAVGPGFPIEFRMSGAEFTPGGYDIDYGIQIAKAVDGLVDLIHVSAGVHDCQSTFIITHPSMFREHGCNVWLAERIKKEVKTPVATIGGLTDPDMLEEIIASGKADVVEMGRQLMADPYLPRKMAEGKEEDITHCIRCFACMDQLRHRRTIRCALNPAIGREDEPAPGKAEVSKTVLVAGGGPAGMEAALAAHGRGHRVILFEATDRLGGQTACERYVPFKYDMYRFGQTLARRIEKAGIEVHLNTPLTAELAAQWKPDAIIAAVGASPIHPPIPVDAAAHVLDCSALREPDYQVGDTVAIIGGGLVGCENAIHFAQQGKKVTVIEMNPEAAKDSAWPHRMAIMEKFEELGIQVLCSAAAKAITADGVAVNCPDGERFIPADTVFMAAGLRPRYDAVDDLRFAAPRFLSTGDCVRPAQLFDAVSGGRYAGMEI